MQNQLLFNKIEDIETVIYNGEHAEDSILYISILTI